MKKLLSSTFINEDISEIQIGSQVIVINVELYSKEMLGLDREDFRDFILKVSDGEKAIVCNCCDETQWVDILFEDGLEVFGVYKLTLKCLDEDVFDLS